MTWFDAPRDFVARGTDVGTEPPVDPSAHRLCDLLQVTLGAWKPVEPSVDVFDGEYSAGGPFVRLDLVIDRLVNPPGELGPFQFNPYVYGDHPVFGFVEIDVDQNVWTGGHLDWQQLRYRYLGNVVRFGGMTPRHDLAPHVATDASAFNNDFLSPPFVERSGEEFHLALLDVGLAELTIEELEGDGDATFEAGETWNVHGPLLHRAHGFEEYIFNGGEYSPQTVVQFSHDTANDTTEISLVFPLTNAAAGLMLGEAPEAIDQNPSNQFSILEALVNLNQSAQFLTIFPSGQPEEAIITAWGDQSPWGYLDPTAWNVTVLLGTSSEIPSPDQVHCVWTDVFPDVVRGDVDGDGSACELDRQAIQQHLSTVDTEDGMTDGSAAIPNFAENFSLYDVNHDGIIDGIDILLVSRPGDGDLDGDLDLADFARLQNCFCSEPFDGRTPTCGLLDLDTDQEVDLEDAGRWTARLLGG